MPEEVVLPCWFLALGNGAKEKVGDKMSMRLSPRDDPREEPLASKHDSDTLR